MGVYVDTMQARLGRMLMCHMIADSTEELLAMVDRIGVDRKWIQDKGTNREHFDIAMTKRRTAMALGAVEISMRQLAEKLRERKGAKCGACGKCALLGASGPCDEHGREAL